MTARLPMPIRRGPLATVLRTYTERVYGQELQPMSIALHHPRVLLSTLLHELSVRCWRSLDPTLQALAVMGAAVEIGCPWCVDFGFWEYNHRGVDPAVLRAVPTWRDGGPFTSLQLTVLEYGAAMTATPPTVTDDLLARLREDLTDRQVVELTALIALENQRSRLNAAVGLTSQGFREICDPASAR